MAKKRRKEKEEEGYDFKMPEFDEEEYLRKEVRDTKTLLVTFVYAVFIGIVSFSLTYVDVALALLVGFIAIVFLRHIYPLVRIDTTLLEKKQWAGNIMMYLFAWLAVLILLSNPPFSDFAAPTIKDEGIYFESNPGNWTKINKSGEHEWHDQNLINVTTNVSIRVTIFDNVEVDVDTIRITIKRGEEEITPSGGDGLTHTEKNEYSYIFSADTQTEYAFTIIASDVNNHEESFSGSILL